MRLLNRALVVGTLVAALTGTAISHTHAQNAEKPNIVIMVMDNLGWGEIGVYGGGMPRLYNLLTDPKEQYDLIEMGGRDGEDNFWVLPPISKLVGAHLSSLEKEPPIKLGTPDPYRPPN